jgi:hypothetical protein
MASQILIDPRCPGARGADYKKSWQQVSAPPDCDWQATLAQFTMQSNEQIPDQEHH